MVDTTHKIEFLSSVLLECVCDDTRRDLLRSLNFQESEKMDLDSFREKIRTSSYKEINRMVQELSKAEMVIMFQVHNGKPLAHCTEYNEIVTLSTPKNKKIPILRSELLDYYNNHTSNGKPKSRIELDIKQSLRLVSVEENQDDPIVGSYIRQSCTIAYIQFDYFFNGIESGSKKSVSHPYRGELYFALFYPYCKNASEILVILKNVRNFLSFRSEFKSKIQKDFEMNMFGKQKEAEWRNDWLSTEKAGAHANNTTMNKIIDESNFNGKILYDTLFNESDSNGGKLFVPLIANVLIARYFRAVMGPPESDFKIYDHIKNRPLERRYRYLTDVIAFSDDEELFLKDIRIRKNIVGNPELYSISAQIEEEDSLFGGIPKTSKITYSKKYLEAFIFDVFCNIEKYGEEAEISIEQTTEDEPSYFVIKNSLKNNAMWDKDFKTLNYILKQSIEFDNASDNSYKRGISLGCIAHFCKYFGKLITYYSIEDTKNYYTIKLPIIKTLKSGGQIDVKTTDN